MKISRSRLRDAAGRGRGDCSARFVINTLCAGEIAPDRGQNCLGENPNGAGQQNAVACIFGRFIPWARRTAETSVSFSPLSAPRPPHFVLGDPSSVTVDPTLLGEVTQRDARPAGLQGTKQVPVSRNLLAACHDHGPWYELGVVAMITGCRCSRNGRQRRCGNLKCPAPPMIFTTRLNKDSSLRTCMRSGRRIVCRLSRIPHLNKAPR
jgi:hypothetical protein